jgi:hypothetical protein
MAGRRTAYRPAAQPDLTRKEGWRNFVEAPPTQAPTKPSVAQWKSMDIRERAAFREARLIHHGAFAIKTPDMQRIHQVMSVLVEANRYHPPGARPCVAVDSDTANVGKTTTVLHYARRHERQERRRHGAERTDAGDEFIPVLPVTLAAGTTVKSLSAQMLDFVAYPYGRRATQVELTQAVQRAAVRCQTSLIPLDDIHFLRVRDKSGREVNDYLKYLATVIPATFIYAGIDLEECGILNEGRGRFESQASSQIASRFTRLRVERFEIRTGDGRRAWRRLLAGIEQQLVLMNASEGMLTNDRMAHYLFGRTSGEIGSLMSLIRQGAIVAIDSGVECLTEKLLGGVQLNHAAETEFKSQRPRNPASRDSKGR